MYYQSTLEFWKEYICNEETWPFDAIEKRLQKKIDLLQDYYKQSKDSTLKKRLNNTTHLDDLNTYYEEGYYGLSEKIVCHYPTVPTYYVGDIHSDAESLEAIINYVSPFDKPCHIIFLGDYVDRGKRHLETLDKLWALKLDLPDKITLLRGNHDGGEFLENGQIQLPYRITDKCQRQDFFPLYLEDLRYQEKVSTHFMKTYFDLCNTYPYIAYTYCKGHWYMGVHGGLARPSESEPFYDYITSIGAMESNKTIDSYKVPLLINFMWSDPIDAYEGSLIENRRFKTYQNHFEAFSKRFGIHQIIRGHQVVLDGHKTFYAGRFHTIFSSGLGSTSSAYTDQVIQPKILKLDHLGLHEITFNSF